MIEIKKYEVTHIEEPVTGVKIFRLTPLDGVIPKFISGQSVFLHIIDGDGSTIEKKPYSIASGPDKRYLEFCIKMVNGKVTGKLELVKLGDTVGLEAPKGRFVYNEEKNAAFIGGGTGIAPFMSMLRFINNKKIDGSFVVFYSVKTKDDILYGQELEEMSQSNPNIKVVITTTKDSVGWSGEQGRVNSSMIRKYIDSTSSFDWWICGPLPMVKDMRAALEETGADLKKLHVEAWG